MQDAHRAVVAQVAFQFCGHLDEYLIAHVRHLTLVRLQTRFGCGGHRVEHYEDGRLVTTEERTSAAGIVGYYRQMWRCWRSAVRAAVRAHGEVEAIFIHPLLAAGLGRGVRRTFWQWDYFPDRNLTNGLFNSVARHFAHRCERYLPLTGAIGRAMGREDVEPLMLGVSPPTEHGDLSRNRLLVVGQLRHGQGVEQVLDFLADHPDYSLSLMGAAANGFESEIAARIAAANLADRVYFPNRFVSESELREEASKCFVALALYQLDAGNLTHYADPGKVKSSIEMGLPVIMTRISEIVPFVERFHAGVVIDSLSELPQAIENVRLNYAKYLEGGRRFAQEFEYCKYYARLLGG